MFDAYLWSEKPSVLSFWGLFEGVGLVIVAGFTLWLGVPAVFFWVPLFGLVIAALMIFVAVARAHSTLYVVSNHGVSKKQTQPSFRIETIPLNKIANITLSWGIWGRIFHFGTLCINSSSLDYNPLVLTGVNNPQALRRLIVAAKQTPQQTP